MAETVYRKMATIIKMHPLSVSAVFLDASFSMLLKRRRLFGYSLSNIIDSKHY